MSSTRYILQPYKTLDLEPAVIGDQYSKETNVLSLAFAYLDIRWSGNVGGGTITVESLRDGKLEWEKISIPQEPITISGASGDHQILFSELPFHSLRLKYNSVAGGETVSCYITGKGV